jgi:hypothetical protein
MPDRFDPRHWSNHQSRRFSLDDEDERPNGEADEMGAVTNVAEVFR